MIGRRWRWGSAALVGLAVGCTPADPDVGDADDPYDVAIGPWEATIRWTEWGVPHVRSDTHGGVAYGLGYAIAREHACVLLDQIVEVRGERPRWYGAGPDDAWLDAAFGWKELDPVGTAERTWAELSDVAREMIVGYATGFNDGVDAWGLPPACDGAPWVRPITHVDLLAYIVALGLDGSGAVFVSDVGRATPPRAVAPPPPRGGVAELGARLRQPRMGSNGWAIGRERSAAGGGLLLSNTHFPAVGEKQWFESHLTLPGVLDVYGASLIGVPITNVGFNAHVAWTHTVSYAPRFVAYALALDPADPTRYRYGDGWESMVGAERRVEVLGEDGVVATSTRTTWRSRYGPVFAAPIVGWTPQLAFTYRDVNAVDAGMFDVWYGMATATSLAELQEAHARSQGIPWVYTLAADAEGAAWFADTSRVPDLSASSIAGWRALQAGGGAVGLLASQFAAYGAILLDGADPGNAWVEDPRAVEPGLVPFEDAPQIERSDYVFNANDSPWLANARAPLLGYDEALYGAARTPRSARTRMNGRYLDEVGPGSASGDDGRFSLEEVEAAALSMRSSIAEVALDDVLASACGAPEGDLAVACDALAGWDGRYTADARGPVIWRLFLTAFEVDDLVDGGGGLLVVPFDPDDPLGTPRGVTADVERLQRALRGAAGWAAELPGDGVPTLGEVQRLALDDGSAVGVPGGQFWEGTIGVADWWQDGTRVALPRFQRPEIVEATSEMTAEGWWVNDGNSFILAVAFEAGAPRARAVMTYGPTDDPRSPLVHGQPELYASGALRPVWFSEADVAAHVVEEVTRSR